MKGIALRAFHQSSVTSMASLAFSSLAVELRYSLANVIMFSTYLGWNVFKRLKK